MAIAQASDPAVSTVVPAEHLSTLQRLLQLVSRRVVRQQEVVEARVGCGQALCVWPRPLYDQLQVAQPTHRCPASARASAPNSTLGGTLLQEPPRPHFRLSGE